MLSYDPNAETTSPEAQEGTEVLLAHLPESDTAPAQRPLASEDGRSIEQIYPAKIPATEDVPAPSRSESPAEPSPKELDLTEVQQSVRQIADALMWAITHAVKEAQAQNKIHNSKIDAILQDLGQITARLDGQEEQIEQLASRQQDYICKLEEITRPMARLEERLHSLEERIIATETQLRTQAEQGSSFAAACERLERTQQALGERLDATEFAIETIEADAQRRGAWLEQLLTSIRGLDKRSEQRYQADAPVRVISEGDHAQVVSGRLLNVSKKGLGLILEAPLTSGDQVRIEVEGRSFSGRVRYCRYRSNGYSAGIVLSQALPVPAE